MALFGLKKKLHFCRWCPFLLPTAKNPDFGRVPRAMVIGNTRGYSKDEVNLMRLVASASHQQNHAKLFSIV